MPCEEEYTDWQEQFEEYEREQQEVDKLEEKCWELAKDLGEHCLDLSAFPACIMEAGEFGKTYANLESAREHRDQERKEADKAADDLNGCMCKEYGTGDELFNEAMEELQRDMLDPQRHEIDYPFLPYPWEPDGVCIPEDVLE